MKKMGKNMVRRKILMKMRSARFYLRISVNKLTYSNKKISDNWKSADPYGRGSENFLDAFFNFFSYKHL